MTCPKFQSKMKLYKYEAGIDKFRWYCGRKGTQVGCEAAGSIRHSSWGTRSKVTLIEVMLVTYDILQNVPAKAMRKEYQLGKEATCDWINFCREVMLDHVENTRSRKGCGDRPGEVKTERCDEERGWENSEGPSKTFTYSVFNTFLMFYGFININKYKNR